MKSKEDQQSAYKQLFRAISLLKDAGEAECFLRDLCTPAELQVMADRLLVVEPIMKGKPYRTIYDETNVSVTTIGRVARFISQGNGGYEMIYKRLEKEDAATATTNSNSKER